MYAILTWWESKTGFLGQEFPWRCQRRTNGILDENVSMPAPSR
jgi:hypothetical protein